MTKNASGQLGLALLLSTNSVVVFSHGLFGLGSVFTAGYMMTVTGLLVVLGRWRSITPVAPDYLALGFCALCALSLILHPQPDLKQLALLALSFAAYPAARGIGDPKRGPVLVLVLAALVALGAVVTASALSDRSAIDHGKPLVFGAFDHAPAQFTMLLAVALFVAVFSRVRLSLIALLSFIPVALFAAAQVRFALAALVATLIFAAIAAPFQRKRLVVLAFVVVVSIIAGSVGRSSITLQYVKYFETSIGAPNLFAAATDTVQMPAPAPAQRCPDVNLKNSIDIRKRVFSEAISLLPRAGMTGIGFRRFAEISCVEGVDIHNSFLQAAVEFGIPSGVLLTALALLLMCRLWRLAAKSHEAAFAAAIVCFSVLISLAHGRLAEDSLLFLSLGYGAAVVADLTAPRKFR